MRIINLDGTEAQLFSVVPLTPSTLNWSADGKWIVFSNRDPIIDEKADQLMAEGYSFDNWNIYALNLTTEEVIQITFADQNESEPAWWP